MKTSYKRDMDHNYLVIDGGKSFDDYQIGMLTKNKIPGLLECSIGWMDDDFSFYYEITSKQSLELLLERKRLSGMEMIKLLEGILTAARSCGEYLLDGADLILQPEYIYLDLDEWTVFLCLNPLLEGAADNQLQTLAEYLLEHLDRQDSDAVAFGYEFYRVAGGENPSLGKMVESWKSAVAAAEKKEADEEDTRAEAGFGQPVETAPETDLYGMQNLKIEVEGRAEKTLGLEEPAAVPGGTTCLTDVSKPGIYLHSQNASYPDFLIEGDSFLVGKKKDAVDGVLKARGISRIHGKISREGGFYYVTDLNSTNGTFLNGGRLDVHEKARLRKGDCLGFADVKYVVEM